VIRRKPLKKVAYFSVNSFLGGAEVATLNYCIKHRKYGSWDPILFVLKEGPLVERARESRVSIVNLNINVRMRNPLSIFRAAYKLRNSLNKHGVSVVHSSMGYAQLISSLATIRTEIKKVWYQHGPVGTLFDRVSSFFYSSLTLFNSNYLKNKALKVPAAFDHQSQIVAPIVQGQEIERRRTSRLSFSHIGRIAPFKNIDGVLSALSESGIKDFQYNIYGGANSKLEKSYLESLKRLVSELKMEDKVFFHGHQNSLELVFSNSDCVIHSCKEFEPFGLTIVETILTGLPIICSSQSGASQFFDDEDCYKYDNHNDLIKQIRVFSKSSEISIEKRITRARKKAKKIFSSEQIIKKLEGLYDKLD